MMSDAIEISDYDPRWPVLFAEIAGRVRAGLGSDLVVAIEHMGSTSVPGLAAKPVVDLNVVIPSAVDLPAASEGLAKLGYVHEGDRGIPGREAFRWPPEMPRHHLYVCAAASEELRRQRVFRDYLRAQPKEMARYAALKRHLAATVPDINAYVAGKTDFILSALRKAETHG